jgi:hypothetical protein
MSSRVDGGSPPREGLVRFDKILGKRTRPLSAKLADDSD